MPNNEVEPLEPSLWLSKLKKVQRTLATGDAAAAERLYRQVYHLLRLAPQPQKTFLPKLPEESVMERWLSSGAFETAVCSMLGTESAFIAQRGAERSEIRIDIALPGSRKPGLGISTSFATAMLAGWVDCLCQEHNRPKPALLNRRIRRKYQPSPRPRSSEH